MKSPPPESDKLGNLKEALSVYKALVETLEKKYPTNELVAAAWGERGNCAQQLMDYNTASNAYRQAMIFPTASSEVRCQARFGLAIVLEKQAALAGNGGATELLKQARELYRDVYLGEAETPNLAWKKKAGTEAARLSELLNEWPQAIELYRDLHRQKLLSADELEKKVAGVERRKRSNEKADGTAI